MPLYETLPKYWSKHMDHNIISAKSYYESYVDINTRLSKLDTNKTYHYPNRTIC